MFSIPRFQESSKDHNYKENTWQSPQDSKTESQNSILLHFAFYNYCKFEDRN